MNPLSKKGQLSNILVHSTSIILNHSHRESLSLSQIHSPQSKNYPLNDQSNIISDVQANNSSMNAPRGQINNNNNNQIISYKSYSKANQMEQQNPFFTPLKTAYKKINYNEGQQQVKLPSVDLTQQNAQSTTNKINKVLLSQGKESIKNNSFSYQNNNNSMNSQQLSHQMKSDSPSNKSGYNYAQLYSNSFKNNDNNTSRHQSSQSILVEPSFLSDRVIQYTRTKNQKTSKQNQIPVDKSFPNITNSTDVESISTPLPLKQDASNKIGIFPSSSQFEKNEEFLKEWLVGNANKNYQPVSANEILELTKNYNLPQKIQQSTSNQKLSLNEEKKLSGNNHRRFIICKNSNELSNSVKNADATEQKHASAESISSSQVPSPLNQDSTQNKSLPQHSVFRTQNMVQSIDKENQQNIPLRTQIEQQLPLNQVSSSQSTLKQILQTSSSKPLFNQPTTELSMLQKRALYKPRRNKLQLWMNEVNVELGSSQTNDSVVEGSEQIDESKMNKEQRDNQIESTPIIQYIPSVVQSQQRLTKTHFIINQSDQKKTFILRPSLNQSNQYPRNDVKNRNIFNYNQINDNQKRNNSQSSFNLETSQTSLNPIQNNQNEEKNIFQKKAKNNIINSSIMRHMSEPKLSTSTTTTTKNQESQDCIESISHKSISQQQICCATNDSQTDQSILPIQKLISATDNIANTPISQSNSIGLKMKVSFANNIKSILKNKSKSITSKPNQTLQTLENISETELGDDSKQKSYLESTKVGLSLSLIGGVSFQRDNSRNSIINDTSAQKNQRNIKKVNFKERVSVFDIRTKQESITTISKQQSFNHNQEIKIKQKQQHL